jgi:hypothetical protein
LLQLDVDKGYTGTIMTVSGNVGNGKNTFAVAAVRSMARKCFHGFNLRDICPYCKKYNFSEKERILKVYSNFPIYLNKDPEFSYLQCEMLDTIADYINLQRGKNHSVVIIDEPNAFGFDSHAMLRGKKYAEITDQAGYKMQHTRKYNQDIIFLTQLWSMVSLRGKRLTSNTVFAVTPTYREFRYGWYKLDTIIPLTISKKFARRKLFPYFDSGHIVGEYEDEEQEVIEIER